MKKQKTLYSQIHEVFCRIRNLQGRGLYFQKAPKMSTRTKLEIRPNADDYNERAHRSMPISAHFHSHTHTKRKPCSKNIKKRAAGSKAAGKALACNVCKIITHALAAECTHTITVDVWVHMFIFIRTRSAFFQPNERFSRNNNYNCLMLSAPRGPFLIMWPQEHTLDTISSAR